MLMYLSANHSCRSCEESAVLAVNPVTVDAAAGTRVFWEKGEDNDVYYLYIGLSTEPLNFIFII